MRSSLAAYLVDFSAPAPRSTFVAPVPPRIVEADLSAARDAGFHEGYAAGMATASGECAARILAVEERAQCVLVEARADWTQTAAALFAERLVEEMRKAQEELANAAAEVLAEIAILAKRRTLADDVERECLSLLRDAAVCKIELSGPSDLLDAIEPKLQGHSIERGAHGGADVRVRIDKTVVQTRLSEWRETLLQAIRKVS